MKQTRTNACNTYKEHENEIMSGTVEQLTTTFIYVNLGSIKPNFLNKIRFPGSLLLHMINQFSFTRVEDNPLV